MLNLFPDDTGARSGRGETAYLRPARGRLRDVAGIFRNDIHDEDRWADDLAIAGAILTFEEVQHSGRSRREAGALVNDFVSGRNIIDHSAVKGMAQLRHKAADFQERLVDWTPREIDAALGSDCIDARIFGSARKGIFVHFGGKAEKH